MIREFSKNASGDRANEISKFATPEKHDDAQLHRGDYVSVTGRSPSLESIEIRAAVVQGKRTVKQRGAVE